MMGSTKIDNELILVFILVTHSDHEAYTAPDVETP